MAQAFSASVHIVPGKQQVLWRSTCERGKVRSLTSRKAAAPIPKMTSESDPSSTSPINSSWSKQRTLYPRIEPYKNGYLDVSEVHKVYYEVSGNPNGLPVCFVHGGPGGGTVPAHRRFFDPEGECTTLCFRVSFHRICAYVFTDHLFMISPSLQDRLI